MACVQELSKSCDILIVRWPVNKEAPFEFREDQQISIIDRNSIQDQELKDLVQAYKPDILVCSGWIDKGYLKAVRSFRKKIPCIVSLDNHWNGTIKQHIARLISPFTLKKTFTHAWVPGKPQEIYARKLGFGSHIIDSFYSADTQLFQTIFEKTFPTKKQAFPHRFLYVARYVEHKGIFELWEAFRQFSEESNSDWELWCLGTGDQWEKRMIHPKIKHFGFVQPHEMESVIQESGVYILPSKFEPWGVSLQEFSVSGFPLLVSDAVGARTKFLIPDGSEKNGIEFKSGSVDEIKKCFFEMSRKEDADLIQMATNSHQLGMSVTPALWVRNLLSVLKK